MLQGDYVEKLYVKLLTVTSVKAVKCILPLLFDSPSYLRVAIYNQKCKLLKSESLDSELHTKDIAAVTTGTEVNGKVQHCHM